MSTSKKPRPDSVLKNLPEAKQWAIAEFAAKHSLAETVAWLREDGIQTSNAALSGWLSSWRLEQRLLRHESTVVQLLKELGRERPEIAPEQLQKLGQEFFTTLALEQQDPKVWFLMQRVNLQQQQLRLDREKFLEGLRSKLEAGLDELAAAFKGNAEAMELYQQARALIAKETK